jgi:N utilization substance protein B
MAVQMLYQLEVGEGRQDEIFRHFNLDDYLRETETPPAEDEPAPTVTPALRSAGEAAFSYATQLVEGVLGNSEEINERIRFHAENWRLERMPTIDRNILRVAIYEMLHGASVPKVVIVDEAIELAKKFGAENSSRFINGLLDGVLKAARKAAKQAKPKQAKPEQAVGADS